MIHVVLSFTIPILFSKFTLLDVDISHGFSFFSSLTHPSKATPVSTQADRPYPDQKVYIRTGNLTPSNQSALSNQLQRKHFDLVLYINGLFDLVIFLFFFLYLLFF